MKNNQKGFAITSFLYAILIVFLVIFGSLLIGIINSELTLQKMKKDVKDELEGNVLKQNGEYAKIVVSPKNVEIAKGDEINLLNGVYLEKYDGTKLTAKITYTSSPAFNNEISDKYTITYSAIYDDITYTNSRTVLVGGGSDQNEVSEFNYTGQYQFVDEGNGNWYANLLTSGTYTSNKDTTVDIFLLGGGGAGNKNGLGGGGGYYQTATKVALTKGTQYPVTIGGGGSTNGASGGQSTAFGYSVNGGSGGVGGTAYSQDCTVYGTNGTGSNVYYYPSDGASGESIGNGYKNVTLAYPTQSVTLTVSGQSVYTIKAYPSGFYKCTIESTNKINYSSGSTGTTTSL